MWREGGRGRRRRREGEGEKRDDERRQGRLGFTLSPPFLSLHEGEKLRYVNASLRILVCGCSGSHRSHGEERGSEIEREMLSCSTQCLSSRRDGEEVRDETAGERQGEQSAATALRGAARLRAKKGKGGKGG